MKLIDVSVVRIYLSEHQHLVPEILRRLRDRDHVRGVTVFRGIAGFGESGRLREASFVDLSLDLPVVVEFFDLPEKIEATLGDLEDVVEPGHMVTWDAKLTINH
ncbi:MAG: DUF190 domain-containing protein [Gammaproteobacteria bacterium]|jgi:PII-like signaling protein